MSLQRNLLVRLKKKKQMHVNQALTFGTDYIIACYLCQLVIAKLINILRALKLIHVTAATVINQGVIFAIALGFVFACYHYHTTDLYLSYTTAGLTASSALLEWFKRLQTEWTIFWRDNV